MIEIMQWARKQPGFTIVELLIVVVVIAILAAITIVAYNGITNRAKDSGVQADVANASKKLETLKLQDSSEQYPASLSGTGIVGSNGNTVTYDYLASDNSYCFQASNGVSRWYATSAMRTPMQGTCGSDSLVGQWQFNGNTNDATSNSLNGTITGSVVLAVGQNGSANGSYSFPGSSAGIAFGNSQLFNQSELTMSAWVRPSNLGTAGQTIIAKEVKYKYRIGNATTVQVLAASDTSWTQTVSCGYSFSNNTWYQVAFTLSTTTGRIKLYVNGNQICDNPGPTSIVSYNTNPVYVGTYNGSGAEGFAGLIDDARFYSRALTAAEMKGLYNAGAQ